jgi:hypothetical protein
MQPMKIPVHKIQSCFTVLASVFIIQKHAMFQQDPIMTYRPETLSDNAYCKHRSGQCVSQPVYDNQADRQ